MVLNKVDSLGFTEREKKRNREWRQGLLESIASQAEGKSRTEALRRSERPQSKHSNGAMRVWNDEEEWLRKELSEINSKK